MEVLQAQLEDFEIAAEQHKSDYEKAKDEIDSLKQEREDLSAQLSMSQQTIKGLSTQADEVSSKKSVGLANNLCADINRLTLFPCLVCTTCCLIVEQ